jgi:Trp operon repressor
MLANLDNEVHFKKVFTDVEVFTAFVKDVLGIEMHIDKVETEKMLDAKVSAIRFKMDLFAEDKEKRIVVEIQKVNYDYTYDRFSKYLLANNTLKWSNSRTYSFDQEVYVIVVVTSRYKIRDIKGELIDKDILVTDINPRTILNEMVPMTSHKMVIINMASPNVNTPPEILDWIDFIRESIQNPATPHINTAKPAIAKAAQLAEREELDPEELAESKIQEMRKDMVSFLKTQATEEVTQKVTEEVTQKVTEEVTEEINRKHIIQAIKRGKLTTKEIAEDFEVSIDYVQQLVNEIQQQN